MTKEQLLEHIRQERNKDYDTSVGWFKWYEETEEKTDELKAHYHDGRKEALEDLTEWIKENWK